MCDHHNPVAMLRSLLHQSVLGHISRRASKAAARGSNRRPSTTANGRPHHSHYARSGLLGAASIVVALGACDGSAMLPTADAPLSLLDSPSAVTPGRPHLNYSDLVTGSGAGGDAGGGAYVTLFGTHLGGTTSITVGGAEVWTSCAKCSVSETRIVLQLSPAAATGVVVVTTPMGTSNALDFTITPTDYFYISPTGSDSASGTAAAPYATLRNFLDQHQVIARNTIVYLMDGLTLAANDGRGFDSSASIDVGGTSATVRLNLIAYPGAVVTIGAPSGSAEFGMKTYANYLTIAGLRLRGYSAFNAYPSIGYLRFIANDISCREVPASFGNNACVEVAASDSNGREATHTEFLGNTVHDTGSASADKTYHAVYFSTDMNTSEIAWNTIGTGVFYGYCRSLLLHSSPNGNPTSGRNQYGYEIHDNFIQKGWCDGIGLASVDPSKGAINVYNNVIVNTGTTSDGSTAAPPNGNNAGIAINTDDDGPSAGVVHVYNNTLYAAGVYSAYHSNGCIGVLAGGATAHLENNVCYQPSASLPYVEASAGGGVADAVSATHNLWFGNGAVPTFDATGLNVDPMLAAPSDASTVSSFVVGISSVPSVGAVIDEGTLE